MKQAIIISGFPGIGKSYITQNEKEFTISDSDSSNFSWLEKGIRHPDFPQNYMDHIISIQNDYDIIFVSSHKVVRDALMQNNIYFYLVYPDKSLKQNYLERFKKRGNDEAFIQMSTTNWESFIDDIESYIEYPFNVYVDRICLTRNNSYLNLRRDIPELMRESKC